MADKFLVANELKEFESVWSDRFRRLVELW